MAAAQFDLTDDFLGLDDLVRESCKGAKLLITVTVLIQRDSGKKDPLTN